MNSCTLSVLRGAVSIVAVGVNEHAQRIPVTRSLSVYLDIIGIVALPVIEKTYPARGILSPSHAEALGEGPVLIGQEGMVNVMAAGVIALVPLHIDEKAVSPYGAEPLGPIIGPV